MPPPFRCCFLLSVASFLLMAGCSAMVVEDIPEPSSPLRSLSEPEQALVHAEQQFGLSLFHAVREAKSNANTFVSPLSVSMALSMALNGADGATRAALEEVLEHPGLAPEAINTAYHDRLRLLRDLDPTVTFALANAIWYREGFPVKDDFVATSQRHFDATVRALNFSRPDALGTINGWVADHTRGAIDKILDRIRSDEVLFLMNALYFKGAWTYAFDEADTREAPFTQHDGSTTSVPMMHQTAELPYTETEMVQVVDLPYGDSLYSMTILLPNEDHTVNDVASALTTERWTTWQNALAPRTVDLRLPRFTLSEETPLNAPLKALGMDVAFQCGRADFTAMSPAGDSLCISRVKHKTFVEVNEEGTEAAAVTSVGIRVISAPAATPVHVDRPFVFIIRERHSGTMLFIGAVNRL